MPINFFANVQKNSVELVGPIQTPKALEASVSSLLNIPKDNIDVRMTRIGGGFGRRLYVHFGLEAALISKKTGAPIKLIYKREDDLTQGTFRPAYKSVYKAALNEKNSSIIDLANFLATFILMFLRSYGFRCCCYGAGCNDSDN